MSRSPPRDKLTAALTPVEARVAASLIEEVQAATESTGSNFAPYAAMGLAALRGHETGASALIEATVKDVPLRGEGLGITGQACQWVAARPDHPSFRDWTFPPPAPLIGVCQGGSVKLRPGLSGSENSGIGGWEALHPRSSSSAG
jgi:hypothetical protein